MVAEPVPVRPGLTIVRKRAWVPEDVEHKIKTLKPKTGLGWLVRDIVQRYHLPVEAAAELLEAISSAVVIESSLSLVKIDGLTGKRIPYGPDGPGDIRPIGFKVITTAGVNFLVDAFQNLTEIELFNFHGIGTGTNAEAVGDTALQTELTTEYNPNSTRATGTQSDGASANIYRTIGTNTLDSGTPAVTEHGIFSSATVAAGTLWDRTTFSAINLTGANGDGLQSTYNLTCSSGG